MLQFVAVADQGNRGQALQRERGLFFALEPSEKMGDRLGIFSDGPDRTVVFQKMLSPEIKRLIIQVTKHHL
jgi:hypothetical protein